MFDSMKMPYPTKMKPFFIIGKNYLDLQMSHIK